MATKSDVEQFLSEFKQKYAVWGIEIDERDINDNTILELEIPSIAYVEKVLMSLTPQDYCEGPVEEKMSMGSPMWIFEKEVKGRKVYIKVSLGKSSMKAKCFSFHFPAYPMKHPFKT